MNWSIRSGNEGKMGLKEEILSETARNDDSLKDGMEALCNRNSLKYINVNLMSSHNGMTESQHCTPFNQRGLPSAGLGHIQLTCWSRW